MWENIVVLVIFDTCYNWPISLLLPYVLNNLFEFSPWRLSRPSVCSYQESLANAFLKKNVQKITCFCKKNYLTFWQIKRKKSSTANPPQTTQTAHTLYLDGAMETPQKYSEIPQHFPVLRDFPKKKRKFPRWDVSVLRRFHSTILDPCYIF